MPSIESDKLKQTIAIIAMIIVGMFLLVSLWGFIPAFLGSVTFYIIFSPLTNYLIKKRNIRKIWAVIITLIISFLVLLLPVLSFSWLLLNKLSSMVVGSENVYQHLYSFNDFLKSKVGFDILSQDNLAEIKSLVSTFIPRLLGETFNIFVNILIMYFILYYLLYSQTDMEKAMIEGLPYEKENAGLFSNELMSQTYANAIGAPLIAVIQGAVSTLGFWFFGIKDPLFWGVICGVVSFFPFLGTPMVWGPAAIIQISSGDQWNGIGLIIYGLIIIVGLDHILRLIIQKKIAQVHPLITLFGVIVGVHWFGIPGFIFGPLLISYFLIMIKIYKNEYGRRILLLKDKSTISSLIEDKSL